MAVITYNCSLFSGVRLLYLKKAFRGKSIQDAFRMCVKPH